MKRFDRLQQILSLDADRDCETIYRLLAEYEFPWDITKALEFALFRTYAVPSIGRLLDRTGEFVKCPQKRYDDTTLLLYEVFHWGPRSPRGREAIDQINAIHWRYRISNEDYLYTLSTFVVTPVRWLDDFGWRELHPHEIRAMTNVMRRMGEGMKISDIPETYQEFSEFFDDYERKYFGFDPGGSRVADATLRLFGEWYPGKVGAVVSRAARLLMDPHLLEAFGYPQPPDFARKLARLALRARAKVIRYGPVRPDHRPVAPRPPTYPQGWTIRGTRPPLLPPLPGPPAGRRKTTPGAPTCGAQELLRASPPLDVSSRSQRVRRDLLLVVLRSPSAAEGSGCCTTAPDRAATSARFGRDLRPVFPAGPPVERQRSEQPDERPEEGEQLRSAGGCQAGVRAATELVSPVPCCRREAQCPCSCPTGAFTRCVHVMQKWYRKGAPGFARTRSATAVVHPLPGLGGGHIRVCGSELNSAAPAEKEILLSRNRSTSD